MNANRLVLAGSFCWNKDCPDYGITNQGNIVKYGRTGKGTQRLKCTTCERVFVQNKGTVFYGRHHSPKEILECLAMLAERNSLAAIHRIKGIKEETVMDWLREDPPCFASALRTIHAKGFISITTIPLWLYLALSGCWHGNLVDFSAAPPGFGGIS